MSIDSFLSLLLLISSDVVATIVDLNCSKLSTWSRFLNFGKFGYKVSYEVILI